MPCKGKLKLRLSLTAKALILISVPLLFEVGSAWLLLDLQKQAEEEAERANRSRAVSDQINQISRNIYEVWNTVSSASRGTWLSSSFLSQSYKKTFNGLREQYTYLINLSGKNEKLVKCAKEAMAAIDEAEALLDKNCLDLRAGKVEEVFANHKDKEKQLKQLYKQMLSQEFFLVEHEEEEFLKNSPVRLREYRQRTISIFVVAMAAHVVFSVILVVFLVGRVTSRLGYLGREVSKLGTGRPLLPLSGGDEIASLSRALSTMATELNALLRKQGAIVNNARDTICAIDDKGCFLSINPAGEELFGLYSDELIASRFIEYLHQADKEIALAWYQGLKSKSEKSRGTEGNTVELRLYRRTGNKAGNIAAKGSAEPLTTLWSGQWSEADRSLFCVIHDISERKELEKAKQEFTAMLTHDLRSPLATIRGLLELLQAGRLGALSDRGRELVEMADRNSTRMMNLINDLLDIEKINSGTMPLEIEEVAVSDLFQEVELSLGQWMKESRIALKINQTSYKVFADRDKLSRVLFNLVSNAVKFSEPGSRVTLSAMPEGEYIKISVTDQGPGIPADKLDSIFERFAQASSADHKEKGGSGLGLAICRAIVNLHGGKIWAQSTAGLGSTFNFTVLAAI